MAYDRDERSRWSSNERGKWRGEREHAGDDRGGFFERAGEQVRSWFGNDDGGRFAGEDRHPGYRPAEPGGGHGDEGWFGSRGGADRDRDERYRPSGWSRGERDDPDRGWSAEPQYRPMAGDYGRSGYRREEQRGSGISGRHDRGDHRGVQRGLRNRDRDDYRDTSFSGSAAQSSHRDRQYHEQRQRHLEEFDRDYQDYHRERQSNFEGDFGNWRERRQGKRQLLAQVREHMDVVGSDGRHVGTVDRVAGDRIILTRSDPEAGGGHHSLSCSDLDRIEGDRLILDSGAEQARRRWRDEDRGRALFEREDQGQAGPHMLDRSFSGTYR